MPSSQESLLRAVTRQSTAKVTGIRLRDPLDPWREREVALADAELLRLARLAREDQVGGGRHEARARGDGLDGDAALRAGEAAHGR